MKVILHKKPIVKFFPKGGPGGQPFWVVIYAECGNVWLTGGCKYSTRDHDPDWTPEEAVSKIGNDRYAITPGVPQPDGTYPFSLDSAWYGKREAKRRMLLVLEIAAEYDWATFKQWDQAKLNECLDRMVSARDMDERSLA